jgi:hypothetical protein
MKGVNPIACAKIACLKSHMRQFKDEHPCSEIVGTCLAPISTSSVAPDCLLFVSSSQSSKCEYNIHNVLPEDLLSKDLILPTTILSSLSRIHLEKQLLYKHVVVQNFHKSASP